MKIIIIILSIIGLLKLVSLFILVCIEVYYKIKSSKDKEFTQIIKEYSIYSEHTFYILPTISVWKSNTSFEITISLFNITYYAYYKLEFEEK